MTPEHAFLWSIKEAPDDDGLRLIFADWLEDNDQPERAELLRLQVELAQLEEWDPRWAELERCEVALLAERGQHWLGPWTKVGKLQRGLLHLNCEAAELPGLVVAAGGEAALAWVEGLGLQGPWEDICCVVLDSPWLRHIPALALWSGYIGPEGAAALAASPHLAHLTKLDLGDNCIWRQGAAALAASLCLAHLTALDLEHNSIFAEGAAALAASPYLTRLKFLSLKGNDIVPAGVAQLKQRYGDACWC